jgi:hypothetical protein
MPTDPVYYKLDVPDGQRQTVETLAKRICRKHGINCANILLTNVAFPEEQVIDTQYLPYLSSIPPDVAAILPAIPTLGFLVAQFGNIIIIPEWLVDIYGAAHGDREAATRRVKHLVERIGQVILPEMFRRSARELRVRLEEAQFTVMTNAFLEVLSYRNTPLDIESVADHVRLQHPDGSREMASPKAWGEYVLWRWAEVETVRNTMAQVSLMPYFPVIQIEAIPPEGEPARLWMYPPSEHLVLPRSRRRPPVMDRPAFWERATRAYWEFVADNIHPPTQAEVAKKIGLARSTFSEYLKEYEMPWPPPYPGASFLNP